MSNLNYEFELNKLNLIKSEAINILLIQTCSQEATVHSAGTYYTKCFNKFYGFTISSLFTGFSMIEKKTATLIL